MFEATLFVIVYFLPVWVAAWRGHQSKAAIGFLDIFLGWTVLGWVIAMVWALSGVNPRTVRA